jgi:hypothetical protein
MPARAVSVGASLEAENLLLAQLVIKHDDSAQVPTRIKVGITAIYFIKPVGSRD